MKKVCVLTLYDSYNYGAYLQAYGTKIFLSDNGFDVYMLDCEKRSKVIKYFLSKKPLKNFEKISKYFTFKKDWKKLNIIKNNQQKFDTAILGSDEIWNIKNKSFEHCPEYFGQNLNSDNIIAYAPSIGYTKPSELLGKTELVKNIGELKKAYPRDVITKEFLEGILNYEPEIVVDPTFLIKDKWEAIAEDNKVKLPMERYILYYSYDDHPVIEKELVQYAKENGLVIISACFIRSWADYSLLVSPLQFLYLLKNADKIATSTFHGTIFSIIFKKNFINFGQSKKVKSLLELYANAMNRRVDLDGTSVEAIYDMYNKKIEFEKIDLNLQSAISKSKQVYLEVINNE